MLRRLLDTLPAALWPRRPSPAPAATRVTSGNGLLDRAFDRLFRRRPLVEELEPRLLFSADLAPVALDALQATSVERVVNTSGEFSDLALSTLRKELVIVDAGVENHADLIDDILRQPGARQIEVVALDGTQDGIEQISRLLAERQDLDAVHLISHGGAGFLQLGNDTLGGEALTQRAAEIASWSQALRTHADLLLYGCDVARGDAGAAFVDALSQLTGADVAASTDKTGDTARGGNWVLERHAGQIESALLVPEGKATSWRGLLGDEFQVNFTTEGDQTTAALDRGSPNAVAFDSAGNFVVVWSSQNQDGNGYGVYARRFAADGTPITGEISVNQQTQNDQRFASVVSDNAGNFTVVWSSKSTDGTGTNIVLRKFDANGSPLTGEIRANATASGDQDNPAIAINRATGEVIVVWQGNGPGDAEGIFFRRFDASGNELDATDRLAHAASGSKEQNPAVAMHTDGSFVIAFEANSHTYAQRFDAAGTAQGAILKVDYELGNNQLPTVAMDAAGNFAVFYREDGLVFKGIWGRGFHADGTDRFGPLKVDSTFTSTDATRPAMAMAADGSFIVTYQKTGADGQDIFAHKYHADGSSNGSPFIVNQLTPGNQSSPSIAMQDANHFVVVWSGKDDGNGSGIGARMFTPANNAPVIMSDGGGAAASLAVSENTLSVTTVSASDAESQPITYSIVGGADAGLFTIDPATGALAFLAAPDYENPADAGLDNTYEVIVEASDGALTDTQTLTVTVTDVGNTLTVTTADDVLDGDTSSIEALVANRGADGLISLREAVIAANNTPGANTLLLASGTYTLTLVGGGGDTPAKGDLDILDPLAILGAGNGLTAIDGLGQTRVLEASADLTLADLTVRGGNGAWGGGLYLFDASANLTRVTFEGNTSSSGGAVYNYRGTLNVTDSTLQGNSANWGGAVYNDAGTTTLLASTVSGNTASAGGGGLYSAGTHAATGAHLWISTSTLSGNTAAEGGAIYAAKGVDIVSSTIAFNTATDGTGAAGGIFLSGGGSYANLTNTLLAHNDGGNANTTLTSLGHNLDSDGTAGLAGPGDLSGVDPLLAPLADNGGYTQTHALLDGSPALDAGDTLAAPLTDQRGVARVGATDIGAYEAPASVNHAPINTLPGPLTAWEDLLTPVEGLSVADADAGGGHPAHELAQVQLGVSNGTLRVTLAGGATISAGANDSASLTLSGSEADLNATLASLAYRGNSHFTGSDTLTIVSQDGAGLTDSGTVAIAVTAVNDAPTVSLPPAQVTKTNTTLTLSTANGNAITVADIDAGGGSVQLTLIANQGTLTLAQTAGLAFASGDGTADASMRFSGTLAAVNAALDGLKFNPVAGHVGAAGVLVQVDDLGNSGSGGPRTAAANLYIDVSSDIRVNTVTANAQTEPAAAMDALGNYVITWTSDNQDGSGRGIYAQRYDADGNPLGAAFRVNSTTNGDQTASAVAMAPDGHFAVVWTGSDGSGKGVYAQRYTASGSALGGEFRVNELTSGDQLAPQVAMAADGSMIVVWSSNSGASRFDVFARRFDASGAAIDAVEFRVNTALDKNQNQPAIAIGASGEFVITWTSTSTVDGSGTGVFAQRFAADGTPLGTEFLVNTTVAGNQDRPSVAIAPDGSFLIAWASAAGQDGDGRGVFAQRFDASGAKLGTEFQVNTHASKDQTQPSVAVDAAGTFTVAWASKEQDGSGWGVYARNYLADGTPAGAEYRVNTAVNGDQSQPVVASGPAAQWVVAWQGNGPGDSSGIFHDLTPSPNDPPQITAPLSVTGTEDVPVVLTGANRIVIADADAAANPVKLTLSASDGTLTLATIAGLSFLIGDGSGDPVISLIGSIHHINQALDGLRLDAPQNFSGTIMLDIAVDDLGYSGTGGPLTAASSVTVTLAAANDAPTLALVIPDQVATEQVAFNFSFDAGTFTDAEGESLSYSSSGLPAWLAFDPLTRTFSGTPTGADVGVSTITITATDGGGATGSTSFTLTVNGVNDAPIATGSAFLPAILEDDPNPPGATVAELFSPNFADPNDAGQAGHGEFGGIAVRGQSVNPAQGRWQYSIDNGATWNNFGFISDANAVALGLDDRLRFLPAADFNGSPNNLSVRLLDGSMPVTGGAAINVSDHGGHTAVSDAVVPLLTAVSPANDAPVLTQVSLTLSEGETVTLCPADFDIRDSDDTDFVFTVSAVTGGHFQLATAPGSAITTFTRAELAAGLVQFVDDGDETPPTFDVTVQDGQHPSNTLSAEVTFLPVNDAPRFTSASIHSADEDQRVELRLTASDAEGDTLTFAISGGADAALFAIDAATGELRLKVTPNYEAPLDANRDNVYEVVITVSDSHGATSSETVKLVVLDVMEPVNPVTETPPDAPGDADAPPQETRESTPAGTELLSGTVAPDHATKGSASDDIEAGPGLTGDIAARGGGAMALRPVLDALGKLVRHTSNPALDTVQASLVRALDALVGDANALQALQTSLENGAFQQQLDELHREMHQMLKLDENMVASSLAVSTSLSVGYVLWLVRGGVLLSSLLSTLPAWQLMDPLPVLGHLKNRKERDDQDDSLEGILKKSRARPRPHPHSSKESST